MIHTKQLLLFLFILSLISINTFAQNPFEQYNYKQKVATLSQGEYNEFHDQDTLVQIGSVILNTKTQEIVAFVKKDTLYSEATLEPDIVSRWLSPDPLAEKYTSWSPYHYTYNNPIKFIDPDGREIVDSNRNKVTLEKDNDGNYTGNFIFAEGTSDDIKTEFNNNEGRLISEMLTINKGQEYVIAADKSEEKISYTITSETKEGSNGRLLLGSTYDKKNDDGKITKTIVTVYKGSINEISKQGTRYAALITQDQKLAMSGIHETHHATNKDDINVRRTKGPGNLGKQHENARKAANDAHFEFRKLNGDFNNEDFD